ncbi:C1 family peptidase [Coprobacter tertius]|uniref:Aminopeptidase n=1 Tax=Coprobacter tertius TaxID=2944915 RepID=A0ABT1MK29_9BACT|nr:C1 family peptidase [Coprobacter tertius]MCP9612796.1 C1 family peptidase [Coprobacter tertius]
MRIVQIAIVAFFLSGISVSVQAQGGITPEMMKEIQQSYKGTPCDKAIRNAIGGTDINVLALNQENRANFDTHFTYKVPSNGITNQKSSGRCWLFTGLNVLRAQAMLKHGIPSLEFSQNYNFFYDQLEKANLFLQGVIDTREKPMDDKTVDWLFHNPLSDGGQFTGISDIIGKYGVVPKQVMPETLSSENTRTITDLIKQKLREQGLQLRALPIKMKSTEIEKRKTEMLGVIYRMLVLSLGEPVEKFTWSLTDEKGNIVNTKEYTPISFYQEYLGNDLTNDYVMLMNDPTREYYKLYTIDYDRHTYDGRNWTYINLPVEDIKKMAIESLKNNVMMYFSCDVGKFLNRKEGTLDIRNYDYESLMGTTFGMDKKQRIQTFSSGSTHAMTLMAVDINADGNPQKWMVENSWGDTGYNGHLIMTDRWFDEYMFRLVVEKRFVPADILKILDTKPVRLPAWDPMFADEN